MEITIEDESNLTLRGLQQYYKNVQENEKNRALTELLDGVDFNQVIIFVNTPDRAKLLSQLLCDCNFPSICTYGKMKQDERLEAYKRFKRFDSRILVSTDMYGRGVDFEKVNMVVNYDCPTATKHSPYPVESYLHRVGRSCRFETKGIAITMLSTEEDMQTLEEIQSRYSAGISEMPSCIDPSTYM